MSRWVLMSALLCSVFRMTTYTVSDLARIVSQALNRALPDEVWVQGEIRDLSRPSSGHVYFTLVDANPDESPAAILPVTLFATEKMAVNRILQRSGAVRMTDGVLVRIRGQISHYAARGTVQLRMTWIDPDFTLGNLAAERERLLRSLEKRELLHKNRALSVPWVPLRVGLVTSSGSAAEADFLDELAGSGYGWKVRAFDARVQGVDAVGDVARGISTLASSDIDVIAVVRGGGAQTDLAAFDSEQVALAIANCRLPVLTGIGHEIDVSVADLVARSHKTPTACAAALVARVDGFVDRIDRIAADTGRLARARVATAQRELKIAGARLVRSADSAGSRSHDRLSHLESRVVREAQSVVRSGSRGMVELGQRITRAGQVHAASAAAAVDRMAATVGVTASRRVDGERSHIEGLGHRLVLLDPQRLFLRGWSVTRTADGELVTGPEAVEPGTALRTTVAGGEIGSVVIEEADNG